MNSNLNTLSEKIETLSAGQITEVEDFVGDHQPDAFSLRPEEMRDGDAGSRCSGNLPRPYFRFAIFALTKFTNAEQTTRKNFASSKPKVFDSRIACLIPASSEV